MALQRAFRSNGKGPAVWAAPWDLLQMVPVFTLQRWTMQSWMMAVARAYRAMRAYYKSDIIVIWAGDGGEIEIFHAKNFQEVRHWLSNGEARTLH